MILLTGSSGHIAGEVVRLLAQAGIPARTLSRRPDNEPQLPGITRMAGDLARPETLPALFEGCTKLFLLTGNVENMPVLQHNAIVAARQAGIAQVVKLSALGASSHSNAQIGRWHYQVEKELRESGLGWTMLRPHHFMQNLLAQAENIVANGVVYSASGAGKIPLIDTRDIAAAAVAVLTQPDHLGKKYVLTGREALSYPQVTEMIGNVIGKPLRCVDESFEEARARRLQAGEPLWLIESTLAIAAYQRAGGATETITSTVQDLTGKLPRTFAEFAADHAATFRGET